ncbi:hypothetical protein O181_001342 [Austropuccinia psidii MF-1]|uniref:Uncharacterized protein n=1 Tax=Austropuccinia psidii MF-1 TaxID=1389203 RepID=A0A9Q3BAL9_9BASI|nr:hypothetical protein [Austropuccinia psidii MF-1]
MNEAQTDKLYHSEPDNTFLSSKQADTTTRSLIGNLQTHPEGIQKGIAAQKVPDPCRLVEKLHQFLPESEKISAPYQHLQVTKWMESIDGKEKHDAFNSRMEGKQPYTTQTSAKNSPSTQKNQFQCKTAATIS